MKNVFIVSAAHQIIQVNSALKDFKLSLDSCLIIAMTSSSNEKVIVETLTHYGLNNFKIYNFWTFKDILFTNKYKALSRFLKSIKNCQNLYVSQYFSDYSLLAFSILKPKKLYLLDEGTASFIVEKHRKSGPNVDYKLWIKSILYRQIIKHPPKIVYYTQYDLKDIKDADSVIKYEFTKTDNNLEFNENSILILGSSIAEVDVVSEMDYFKMMQIIIQKNPFKKALYYPHRKEGEDKLNSIKKLGIEIISSTMPFELYFNNLKSTTAIYYSFYSPVLDNLTKQYLNLPELNIIRLDENIVLKNLDVINNIYDEYAQNPKLNVIYPQEL